jgi:hypothetical protein
VKFLIGQKILGRILERDATMRPVLPTPWNQVKQLMRRRHFPFFITRLIAFGGAGSIEPFSHFILQSARSFGP